MRSAIIVASESNPDRTYKITVGSNGAPYCSCPAWSFHIKPDKRGWRICKHIKSVKLPKEVKTKSKPSASIWEERFCPKCNKLVNTLQAFGSQCLRCGSETGKENPDE